MKKALALILTAAMLFSCLAVGASAARVYSVEEKVVKEDKIVWSDSSGVYGSTDPFFSGDHTLTITLKGDEAGAGKNFEVVAYIGGSPVIDAVNDKISFNGAPSQLDYDFADATWYEVQYVVEGDTTTVKVNGETVGTIDAYMQPMVYGTFYRCYIGEIIFTDADGNVRWGDDYEDGEDSIMSLPVSSTSIEGERHDLGLYYWGMDASAGHYLYPEVNASGVTVEFDFVFDSLTATDGTTNCTANWGNLFELDLQADKVGVNGQKLDYDFDADVWYHVEFIPDGASTAIYVDGAYVGTVAAVLGERLIGGLHGMGIDNLRIGDYFEDFEDKDFAKKSDSAGAAYNYVFDVEDPVDPFLTMGMDKAAEGDAYLLEDRNGAYGIGYAQDYPSGVVVNGAVAYSFDLALLPNNHRGAAYSEEKDPDGSQTWFEIWRDTADKRFKVGFDKENEQYSGFAGESDSLLGFDWGEMTADNFHNVVMVFKDRQGYIYVDGELFYQGPGGSAGISNSNTTLFGIVGGSAIIDNFEIYNVEDLKSVELMYEGAPFGGKITDNGSWEGMKGWTVGADCAENGHVFHNIDITVNETCYSLGEDTVYCAVCGEGYETHDRAMLPHNYTKYDINRTQDGLIYAHCQADGCVEKKFTTMTTEAYTGSVSIFMDMGDDLASAIYDGPSEEPNLFDNFKYENGVATTCEETYLQNYSRFDMEKFANNKPISGDWSVTFDLTYNTTWDTDDVINSKYEHYSLYMLGGNNNAFVTFNFEKDYVKISPNTYSNPAVTVIEKPFDFVEGETYNVQFSFHQHEVIIDEWEEDGEWIVWSEPAVDFYVRINGVNVIKYDYAALESGTLGISYENPNASFPGFYNQNFGVNYSMDNFVVATSDFTWNERTYVGDVNGDNYLDAADALAMRKLLAKVIDDSELATSRMDANADGAINAKDQLTIRKALVA
ncbi:MAG: dockerin type I repeat-containing protein [Clostridia bacterium]|nr:dockerin type I repeat-containing protein [Clostridia bacterium]